MPIQRYYRVQMPEGPVWALETDKGYQLGSGCPYTDDWSLRDKYVAPNTAVLLPPVTPRTIIGVGRSYPAPGADFAQNPILFAKFPSCVIGPGGRVRAHPAFQSIMAEGELVLVIGKTLRSASPQDAEAAIFGVSIGNDVTGLPIDMARLLELKAADTFAPVGPCIAAGLDVTNLKITTCVNGAVIASGNTRDHGYGFGALLSYVSKFFTLEPGDIVFTGSPAIAPEVLLGDVVSIEIEGLGRLENTIA